MREKELEKPDSDIPRGHDSIPRPQAASELSKDITSSSDDCLSIDEIEHLDLFDEAYLLEIEAHLDRCSHCAALVYGRAPDLVDVGMLVSMADETVNAWAASKAAKLADDDESASAPLADSVPVAATSKAQTLQDGAIGIPRAKSQSQPRLQKTPSASHPNRSANGWWFEAEKLILGVLAVGIVIVVGWNIDRVGNLFNGDSDSAGVYMASDQSHRRSPHLIPHDWDAYWSAPGETSQQPESSIWLWELGMGYEAQDEHRQAVEMYMEAMRMASTEFDMYAESERSLSVEPDRAFALWPRQHREVYELALELVDDGQTASEALRKALQTVKQ